MILFKIKVDCPIRFSNYLYRMKSKDQRSKCKYNNKNSMMSQHFVTNNLVGFEYNVSTEDFMELVAWNECLDNRNGKVRKTSTRELAAVEK